MKHVVVLPLVVMGLLTACGGGGGGENNTPIATAPSCKVTEILKDGVCTAPVAPPISCKTTEILKDGACVKSNANICTVEDEKLWVRSHLDDVYLWYNEIKDVPKQNYDTPQKYFDALLVKDKDRFSFVENTQKIEDFQESGLNVGYGIRWMNDPHTGFVRVAFVEPDSPAQSIGLERGDYLNAIDGIPVSSFTQEEFSRRLFPTKVGVQQVFSVYRYQQQRTEDVVITTKDFVQNPAPYLYINPVDGVNVGYLLFNEHIATATDILREMVTVLQAQKVTELVLDLRFNGGGFLYTAQDLASMLAGTKALNSVFSSLQHNDKSRQQNKNFFFSRGSIFTNASLPMLNLNRVFVLTSGQTCSASEAIINGLLPFMDVIRIGDTTCGKPYGMLQENNCDKTYFAVRFRGVNMVGQSVPTAGYTPRCFITDSPDYTLGDTRESLFAAALSYRKTGQCPSNMITQSKRPPNITNRMILSSGSWRNNMLLKKN